MANSALSALADTLRISLRDLSPVIETDVSEQGDDMLVVTVRNPHDPYRGVTYEAGADHNGNVMGSLWFGQCEITGMLEAADAEAAIRSVVNGEIVTVVRYRNEEDRTDRHPTDRQWVFQLFPDGQDDDTPRYTALIRKLRSKPTLWDRLDRWAVGVFEVARWGEVTVIQR